MTTKDLLFIAAIIRELPADAVGDKSLLIYQFANDLQRLHPRMDREQFVSMCLEANP